jgi:hypothetical protein
VELALLLPIFALVLFWAVYFTEFSVLRIRQQEASRFLAWETATGLSDFRTGRHDARFASVRERALERTKARYANLQGHDLSPHSSTWLAKPRLGDLELRAVGYVDSPTEPIGHQVLGGAERSASGKDPLLPSLSTLLRGIEGRLDASLRAMGFPTRAIGASTELGLEVENRWMEGDGSIFPDAVRRVALSPAVAHLESETWALEDGGDVGAADLDHPFTRQVGRMAYFGIGDRLGGVLRNFGLQSLFPFPPTARVVSQRYGSPGTDPSRLDCRGEPLSATGKWRNGPAVGTREDRMSAVKCFDTLPMEANGLGSGYEKDPVFRQLRARGEGYLGREIGEVAEP